MRRLRQRFPDELVVIGVHSAKFPSEQLTANIRAAVLRHDILHPVVNDAGFKIWNSYTVRAWPTLVLVDPRGKIAYEASGEILADELIPQFERLIAEYEAQGLLDRRPLRLQTERSAQAWRPLSFPAKLASDGERLFVADSGHHRILELRLDASGAQAQLVRAFGSGMPGLCDGPAGEAQFHDPHGLALAGHALYVADTGNHAVRLVDLQSGAVQTLAGTGRKGHGRFTFGTPTETPLRSPWDVLAVGPAQPAENPLLFIAMAGSHQVWLMLEDGRLGVFAGNGREALVDGPLGEASFNQPSGLAFGLGHLFVADPEASAIRAISLGEHAQVLTLVGQGLFEFGDLDGSGAAVRLQHPGGIAYAGGLVYIADSYNHKVKTLDPASGVVKTLLGSGAAGDRDGPFDQAELFEPGGLALQGQRLYIADTNNHAIRLADLAAGRLVTLTLLGLERLESAPEPVSPASLPALHLRPGVVHLEFTFELPVGHKLNPDAPLSLQVSGQPAQFFAAGQPVVLSLALSQDTTLQLDLGLYYCQVDAAQLCLLHNARLRLPLHIDPGAGDSARVSYRIG